MSPKTRADGSTLIRLYANTGARLSEAGNLRVTDVDLNTASVHFHGKGAKDRRVRFGLKTARALSRYLRARDKHKGAGRAVDLAAVASGADPPAVDLPGQRPTPRLDPEVVGLVLRLARENPRWGYLRIVGECRKLGVRVSATSVRADPAPPPARAGAPSRPDLDAVPAHAGNPDARL